ncbi:unnamed protein product [Symbiodinium necroappetens]|uniref:Uncharacterized protein n=1 Tax=Symbiodinium necroappetens TaxID=1628268 RepID=A0A812SBX1_9DINO|nr:unnamed protein product [Symbiodinium necroappetens]
MEASRKATFVAAEKVICLVSAMMQAQVLNDDIGACDDLSVDTSSLDLPPFRNAPPKPTCDYSSVTALPCDSDFLSQYYTSQDWHAEASADTCTPCASGRFSACSDLWSGLTSQLGACFKLRRSKLRGQPTPEVTARTPSSLEANRAEGGVLFGLTSTSLFKKGSFRKGATGAGAGDAYESLSLPARLDEKGWQKGYGYSGFGYMTPSPFAVPQEGVLNAKAIEDQYVNSRHKRRPPALPQHLSFVAEFCNPFVPAAGGSPLHLYGAVA